MGLVQDLHRVGTNFKIPSSPQSPEALFWASTRGPHRRDLAQAHPQPSTTTTCERLHTYMHENIPPMAGAKVFPSISPDFPIRYIKQINSQLKASQAPEAWPP